MKFAIKIFLWLSLAVPLQAQLVVRVTSLPSSTPDNSSIHVAGNFNKWQADDQNYQLTDNEDGTKSISLYPQVGKVEYKFTRGSWESAEAGLDGEYVPNRVYQYDGKPSVVNVAILSWEDLDGKRANSTATSNVHIMSYHFNMPQLGRERKVWVYLPPDYETSEKRYPVIYMQDGQNLFDKSTAFGEEWNVDESMNKLFENGDYGAIIIGVDNGGWRRMDEYSPWYNAELEAGGEGKNYVDFLVNTLKPYIDATYRTLPSKEYTGIMGSSLGALITHYAAMEHPNVFGKVGVLSPSFWFAPESYNHTANHNKTEDIKYYVLAGKGEGTDMVKGLNKMTEKMTQVGYASNVKKVIHNAGNHSETFWGQEFTNAYTWLFGDMNYPNKEEVVKTQNESAIKIIPNNAFSKLYIENLGNVEGAEVHVTSEDGKFVRKFSVMGDEPLDIQNVHEGMHVVNVVLQNRVIFTEKLNVSRG
ncbi:MAG: alpha/beta hydrolase-fold protein [Saprospiraceae bacterium]